jgi:hypothetical protein
MMAIIEARRAKGEITISESVPLLSRQEAGQQLINSAAALNNPKLTEAVRQYVDMNENLIRTPGTDWTVRDDNATTLSRAINNELTGYGVYVALDPVAVASKQGEGNTVFAVTSFEIIGKETVPMKNGDSPTIFEIKSLPYGQGERYRDTGGFHWTGDKHAFILTGSVDGYVREYKNSDAAKFGENLKQLSPDSSIPKQISNQIEAGWTRVTPAQERQVVSKSISEHEGFHVSFSNQGGNQAVSSKEMPQNFGAVLEQGAFLHQLAHSDPAIVKSVLMTMFKHAFNDNFASPHAGGNRMALGDLQQQLPGITFLDGKSGKFADRINPAQLLNLFSQKPEVIQAAAARASDAYLNRYIPQVR